MWPRRTLLLVLTGCATPAAHEPVMPAAPPVVVEPAAAPAAGSKAPPENAHAEKTEKEAGALGLLPQEMTETVAEDEIGGAFGVVGVGSSADGGTGEWIGPGTIGRGSGTGNAAGAIKVTGWLDKEVIRRTIHREIDRLRACYERELAKQPNLEGRLGVDFTIAPDGRVSKATAKTPLDPSVDACVLAVFKSIRFPKPKGNGPVTVYYPLVLKHSD